MLTNAIEMTKKAKEGRYAVAQININNLEWTKAVLETAEELKSPVILGASGSAAKYMAGLSTVVAMVNAMDASLNVSVPVALHLDHGSYEDSMKCIKAGFTSIMFDGSHFPIEENLEKTKELLKCAHDSGLSIEAEVGSIGGTEDGVVGMGEIADPKQCARIAELGIDLLAAGIGNIHGVYPENWKGLAFDALEKIHAAVGSVPLVLHGGTGIPEAMIKKAIGLGVSKINVNTECQIAFAAATRKYIEDKKDLEDKGFDPRKLLLPGFEAIKAAVREKMLLFGSDGKA
jgi:fructose-bisphosphate aldolase class II